MKIFHKDDVVVLSFDTHTQYKKFRNYLRQLKYEVLVLNSPKLELTILLNRSSYAKFLEELLVYDNIPLF